MGEQKSGFKLWVYGILIVLLLFGHLGIFVRRTQTFFDLELLGFLFLLILSFIGLITYVNWGEKVLFFVFLFYMGNLALVWLYDGSLYMVLLFLALFGFLLSIPRHQEEFTFPEPSESDIPHSEVDVKSPAVKVAQATSTQATPTHSPGKFVASISSNVYHAPKCDWAKKIKKPRQVWFSKKEDAWEKGYRAHSCVE